MRKERAYKIHRDCEIWTSRRSRIPPLRWLIPPFLLILSFAVLAAANRRPDFAEWYARTVYPVLVGTVGRVFGLVLFSAGECIIAALAVTAAVFLVKLARRREGRGDLLRRGALGLLWIVSVILLLYAFHCGINYHRRPFSSLAGLAVWPSSAEELAALEEDLILTANGLSEGLSAEFSLERGGVTTALSVSPWELSKRAADVMRTLGRIYPELDGYYPRTKPVLLSRGMSMLDITGVYYPPTIEANINVDVPAYNIAATACHELSHLRGFMREDEANFIAYLACRESGDPEFHYSGAMLALAHVRNALRRADRALSDGLDERMNERVRADFAQNSEYWSRFEGPVSTVSQAVNDTYLKVNAQSDGLESYGRMVDLLLADYRLRYGFA